MRSINDSSSIIASSFKKARMGILIMMCSILIGVGIIYLEYAYFNTQIESAQKNEQEIRDLSTMIRHMDEQLTMSAALAVHTGDNKWISNYNIFNTKMSNALEKLHSHVPDEQLHDPILEIERLNTTLVNIETQAINLAEDGNFVEAQIIFYSREYNDNKAALTNSMLKLTNLVKSHVAADLKIYMLKTAAFEIFSLALVILVLILIWRMVNSHMTKSESIFTEAESNIRKSAHFDHLTGLANREYLIRELEATININDTNAETMAILIMDLDHFKPINDQYGHLVGDVVLKKVAKRMQNIFGKDAFCARLGGDEFVCVLHKKHDVDNALELATNFVKNIQKPIITAGLSLHISTSIGVALYPEHAIDSEGLLFHADCALYDVKQNGRSNVAVFNEGMLHEDNRVHNSKDRHVRIKEKGTENSTKMTQNNKSAMDISIEKTATS